MAEFPSRVGEMRPFFGKRYHFEPQPDITAYELAQIIKVVSGQTGGVSLNRALELPNGIYGELARHFRVEEH
ncbi:hypothetical protein ACLBX9_12835 [Methylobacterium sp. A49B]